MNDLKTMEVKLDALLSRLARLDETATKADDALNQVQGAEDALKKALEQVSSTKTQIDGLASSTTTAQQGVTAALASVKQQSEDAARLIATITTTEGQAKNTNDQVSELLKQTQEKVNELNTAVSSSQTALKTSQDSTAELLRETKKQTSDLEDQQKKSFDALAEELRGSAATLKGNSESTIKTFEEQSKTALNTATQKAAETLTKIGSDFEVSSGTLITEESEKLRTLTDNLKALELQIKDQIEKAIGFSLFNAFQQRQDSIVTSKKFWQWSLFACVGAGILLACYFIWALHGMTTFTYAYFAKFALSLPVIYAISFCNIQYVKERRLEEEYAFKASISVSLNPYQELVGRLVDLKLADERAKYTDFIIGSIKTVFESPTDKVYESEAKSTDTTSLEKVSKQLAPVLEPLAKIFGHK